MKKYQVFIDTPTNGDWLQIYVETMEVMAFNCNDAKIEANRQAQELYEDFYVWEVLESDIIN